MQNHKIIRLIKESNHLPQMPKTFGEILNMLITPYDFNMDECIEEFSKYPELVDNLIQVLNYNAKLKRKIENIKDAVVYLGAKNAKLIVASYITRLLLPNKKGRTEIFDNNNYWNHCIGTSVASYMIANRTGLSDKDKVFTYGLIHDIGVTVLDICLPEYLDKIYALQKKGLHQIAAEKIVLNGITHSEIGLWLCKEWGLPDEIAEIVGFHHTPYSSTSEYITEVKIMYLADSISTNYYQQLLGNEITFQYAEEIMEALKITKEFMDEIIDVLPKEVEKINSIIEINF